MNTQQLEQLKAEREKIRREIAQLQGRLEGVEFSLSLMTGEPVATPAIDSSPPRQSRGTVKTTVLSLVEEHKANGLTASEVVELAERIGVRLERGSVSSLLSKLKSDGALDIRDGNKYIPKRAVRAVILNQDAA